MISDHFLKKKKHPAELLSHIIKILNSFVAINYILDHFGGKKYFRWKIKKIKIKIQ